MSDDEEEYEYTPPEDDDDAPPPPMERFLSRVVSESSSAAVYDEGYRELNVSRRDIVARLREVAGVDKSEATTLLLAVRWDVALLLERLFEPGFRESLGVTNGCASLPAGATLESPFHCDAALAECLYRDGDALPCGHWFSREAWKDALSTLISDAHLVRVEHIEAVADAVCLASPSCKERVRPFLFKKHLPPPALLKYEHIILRSTTALVPVHLRRSAWCAEGGCSHVVPLDAGARTCAGVARHGVALTSSTPIDGKA